MAGVLVLALFALVLFIAFPSSAFAAEETGPASIQATLDESGVLHVREIRVIEPDSREHASQWVFLGDYDASQPDFAFDEERPVSFIVGDAEIDLEQTTTADALETADPEKPLCVLDELGEREGRPSASFYPPERQAHERSFVVVVRYKLFNRVKLHADVAELNWGLVSSIRDESFASVDVSLSLPGVVENSANADGAQDVHAWCFKAPSPHISVINDKSGSVIQYAVENVRRYTAYGLRATMPASWFAGSPLVSDGENAYEFIKMEEAYGSDVASFVCAFPPFFLPLLFVLVVSVFFALIALLNREKLGQLRRRRKPEKATTEVPGEDDFELQRLSVRLRVFVLAVGIPIVIIMAIPLFTQGGERPVEESTESFEGYYRTDYYDNSHRDGQEVFCLYTPFCQFALPSGWEFADEAEIEAEAVDATDGLRLGGWDVSRLHSPVLQMTARCDENNRSTSLITIPELHERRFTRLSALERAERREYVRDLAESRKAAIEKRYPSAPSGERSIELGEADFVFNGVVERCEYISYAKDIEGKTIFVIEIVVPNRETTVVVAAQSEDEGDLAGIIEYYADMSYEFGVHDDDETGTDEESDEESEGSSSSGGSSHGTAEPDDSDWDDSGRDDGTYTSSRDDTSKGKMHSGDPVLVIVIIIIFMIAAKALWKKDEEKVEEPIHADDEADERRVGYDGSKQPVEKQIDLSESSEGEDANQESAGHVIPTVAQEGATEEGGDGQNYAVQTAELKAAYDTELVDDSLFGTSLEEYAEEGVRADLLVFYDTRLLSDFALQQYDEYLASAPSPDEAIARERDQLKAIVDLMHDHDVLYQIVRPELTENLRIMEDVFDMDHDVFNARLDSLKRLSRYAEYKGIPASEVLAWFTELDCLEYFEESNPARADLWRAVYPGDR